MQDIKQAVRDNRVIRKQMLDCFRAKGHHLHRVADDIAEGMLEAVNEENKEMLEKKR